MTARRGLDEPCLTNEEIKRLKRVAEIVEVGGTDSDPENSTGVGRRDVLRTLGLAGVGVAGSGVVAARPDDSDGENGHGDRTPPPTVLRVDEATWRGPETGRETVSPDSGRVYEAVDAGPSNASFRTYYGNGDRWILQGRAPVSVRTDRLTAQTSGVNGIFTDRGQTLAEDCSTWGSRVDYYGAIPDRSKGIVVFGFDDGHEADYTDIYPEFKRRGMPWAENVPSARVEHDDFLDRSQLNEMVTHGAEIVPHSRNNERISTDMSRRELRVELLGSKRDMETHGWQIRGFLGPGTTGLSDGMGDGDAASNNFDAPLSYMLRTVYDWSYGRTYGRFTAVDHPRRHGTLREVSIDHASESKIRNAIDTIVETNDTLEVFGHPTTWGSSELTKLRHILDYCYAKRTDGELLVTTPTTKHLADKTPDDVNFAPNPGAEAYDSFSDDRYWSSFGNPPAW